jgi:hypothetical protein
MVILPAILLHVLFDDVVGQHEQRNSKAELRSSAAVNGLLRS